MPKPSVPANEPPIGQDTQFKTPWKLFFNALTKKNTTTPVLDTVAGSPTVFQAPDDGFYTVSGAGVTKIELARNGSSYIDTGSKGGQFVVQVGDLMRVTYGAAPTVYFWGAW